MQSQGVKESRKNAASHESRVASHEKIRDSGQGALPSYTVAVVLMLVPFHALLTVWASTLLGHYTLLRLWPEIVLLGLTVWWILRGLPGRTWGELNGRRLAWSVTVYAGLNVLYYFISLVKGVGLQAASYGLLLNVRHVVWFVLVYAVARRSGWLKENWRKLVLLPLAIVAAFALLQFFVLPTDFLSHFGYQKGVTIPASQTINQDTSTIRVQSTLRGPNPLGAYLLAGVALAWIAILPRARKAALLAGVLGALVLSFSRSAWLGLLVTGLAWLAATKGLIRQSKTVLRISLALLAVLLGVLFLLQSNQGFKNAVLHVNDRSTAPQTSNEDRLAALQNGASDVLHEPLGRGVGTAGPASVYSETAKPRNSENYFLSLGQETGWLGMVLFLLICARLGLTLYHQEDRLARMLFSVLAGLTLVNLLSYAWADVTLAYLWWGLAAIALSAMPDTIGRLNKTRG